MTKMHVLIATLFLGFECLGMENNSRKRPLSACSQIENFPQDSNQFKLFNSDDLEQDSVCHVPSNIKNVGKFEYPFQLFCVEDLQEDSIFSPRSSKTISPVAVYEQEKQINEGKRRRISGFDLSKEQLRKLLKAQDKSLSKDLRLRNLYHYVQTSECTVNGKRANRDDAIRIRKQAAKLMEKEANL
ncbi:MAG: hypothetical protein ACXWL5_01540 [Candidatus Chromulinivorax sp.]